MAKTRKNNFLSQHRAYVICCVIFMVCLAIKMKLLYANTAAFGTQIFMVQLLFLLTISGLPAMALRDAVEKQARFRLSREQYVLAARNLPAANILAVVLGGLLELFLLIRSTYLTSLFFNQSIYGKLPLIALGVSIFFMLLIASYQGMLHAFGVGKVSEFVPAIFGSFDLFGTLLFSKLFVKVATPHSLLLHDENILASFYVLGCMCGILLGLVATLLWNIIMWSQTKRQYRAELNDYLMTDNEGFTGRMFSILQHMGKSILTGIMLYGAPCILMLFVFLNHRSSGASYVLEMGAYGLVWLLFPMLIIGTLAKDQAHHVGKCVRREDNYHAGVEMLYGVRIYLLFILPMVTILLMLLPIIQQGVFGVEPEVSTLWLFVDVALFCLAILLHQMLEKANMSLLVLIGTAIAFFIFVIAVSIQTERDITAIMLYKLFALLYGILSLAFFLLFFARCYHKKRLQFLLVPILGEIVVYVSGMLCMSLRSGLGDVMCTLFVVVIPLVLHGVLMIALKGVEKKEYARFPQGGFFTLLSGLLRI